MSEVEQNDTPQVEETQVEETQVEETSPEDGVTDELELQRIRRAAVEKDSDDE